MNATHVGWRLLNYSHGGWSCCQPRDLLGLILQKILDCTKKEGTGEWWRKGLCHPRSFIHFFRWKWCMLMHVFEVRLHVP